MKPSPNQTAPITLSDLPDCEDVADMACETAMRTGPGPVQFGPVTFRADRQYVVRPAPAQYLEAELLWCHTKSERVRDLERISERLGGPASLSVWNRHTDPDGNTIGNHGRTVLRGGRYELMVDALKADPHTRRAILIYPDRDAIRKARNRDMNDLSCTIYCHAWIADDVLVYHVNMRALDLGMGYPADFAWHHHLAAEHLLPDVAEATGATSVELLCTAGVATVYTHHRAALESTQMVANPPEWPTSMGECRFAPHGEYYHVWSDLCL